MLAVMYWYHQTNSATAESNITTVWYGHYYKSLKSNGDISNQSSIEFIMKDIFKSQSIYFSVLCIGCRACDWYILNE